AAPRVDAKWRVFAVISEAQPDRLRRIETWLCRQGSSEGNPHYAVLIDFVPASSGPAAGGYLVGDEFEAELCFYRSTIPLRAQIATLRKGAEQSKAPITLTNATLGVSYTHYERALAQLPWLWTLPLTFRSATLRRYGTQLYLRDEETGLSLPLPSTQ